MIRVEGGGLETYILEILRDGECGCLRYWNGGDDRSPNFLDIRTILGSIRGDGADYHRNIVGSVCGYGLPWSNVVGNDALDGGCDGLACGECC